MSTPLYSVGTWDMDKQSFAPHRSLSVPPYSITLAQLRQAVRELRQKGYTAHRVRDAHGDYDDNDSYVLIERTDGMHPLEIRRSWKR